MDTTTTAANVVGVALDEVEKLRRYLQKFKSIQVRTTSEQKLIRTVALNWFQNHQVNLQTSPDWEALTQVRDTYTTLNELTHKATSRSVYLDILKSLQSYLIQLRSELLSGANKFVVTKNIPNLEKLVGNTEMRRIIYRRWEEVESCLEKAPLACVVMMGALLEALFLVRINLLEDKSAIFKLPTVPIDPETKKPLAMSKWTLKIYINVAHEMKWIRKSARDVSETIMEYRNLVHPEKQFRLKIILEPQDARMFWVIFTELSTQIIESAPK